jgi:hypothetical protein
MGTSVPEVTNLVTTHASGLQLYEKHARNIIRVCDLCLMTWYLVSKLRVSVA